MKKLVLHASSFDAFWAHYCLHQDQDFIEKLASLGYSLFLSNQTDLKSADFVLFSEATSVGLQRFGLSPKIKYFVKILVGRIPLQKRDVFEECQALGLHDRTALMVFEGKIHLPENHVPKLGELFPIVFTWNDEMVDGKRFFKFRWPQPVYWPKVESISYEGKKLLVNISANKYKSHPLELYSARRISIQHFERKFGDQFDLYGVGWNKPATISQRYLKSPIPFYPSFKGQVASKADVFPKYRFALCYENASVPGWITEKIFDCMRSDCVPIYLGAPNINDYLPSDTFIDRRKFSSDDQLAEFILSIDKKEYENYQKSIASYLSSSQFSTFLSTTLAETIVNIIENHPPKP